MCRLETPASHFARVAWTLHASERDSDPELYHSRRLDGGGQSRRGAGDGELLDFERLVEQVVSVEDRGQAVRAEAEAFLQPRVDGHRKRESRPAVAEGAH